VAPDCSKWKSVLSIQIPGDTAVISATSLTIFWSPISRRSMLSA